MRTVLFQQQYSHLSSLLFITVLIVSHTTPLLLTIIEHFSLDEISVIFFFFYYLFLITLLLYDEGQAISFVDRTPRSSQQRSSQ